MSAFKLLSLSTAALSLASVARGFDFGNDTEDATSQILSLPLKRIDQQQGAVTSIQKRYFSAEILGVYGAAYLAQINIGNPEQAVDVLLDTGSFELWVDPDCAKSNVPDYCNYFGSYDPAKSNTSHNLMSDFEIDYGSGNATGLYYTDNIRISGAEIKNQQFGVANQSSMVWFGILGLAYGKGNGFINYDTMIDSLQAQGFTNSKLFSLDLGSQGNGTAAVTGEVVFGGVDKNKYAGALAEIPTDPKDAHYSVNMTGLAIKTPGSSSSTSFAVNGVDLTSSGQSSNMTTFTGSDLSARQAATFPMSVIIDSGTTLTLLPQALTSQIAAQFQGATADGSGGYTVPCSYQSEDGSVSFSFAGANAQTVTITVPYSEFIWNSGSTNGQETCYLGVWSDDSVGLNILGDSFLRGAYVVFDQDNNAVYMAEYASCGTGSDYAAVPAGANAAAAIAGNCQATAASPTSAASTANSAAQATATATPATNAVDPAGTVTATETITTTVTEFITYTANGQTGVSTNVYVTTYCPEDHLTQAAAAAATTTTSTSCSETEATAAATLVAAPVLQAGNAAAVTVTEHCETTTFTTNGTPVTSTFTVTETLTNVETVETSAPAANVAPALQAAASSSGFITSTCSESEVALSTAPSSVVAPVINVGYNSSIPAAGTGAIAAAATTSSSVPISGTAEREVPWIGVSLSVVLGLLLTL